MISTYYNIIIYIIHLYHNKILFYIFCPANHHRKHYFMIIVEKANYGQVTMVPFMIFLAILYNINLIKYRTRVILDTKFSGPAYKEHSFGLRVACPRYNIINRQILHIYDIRLHATTAIWTKMTSKQFA